MDPAIRRTLIALGVGVVVLVALFVVSAAHNPDGNSPGSGCSSSQRDAWRARLLGSEPVASGQLRGCTTVPGPFTITGSCELTIAAAGARSRQLVVKALDAIELGLVTNADGRLITMRVKLEPGQSKPIFVGKNGQTVEFRCRTGTSCRAGIQ